MTTKKRKLSAKMKARVAKGLPAIDPKMRPIPEPLEFRPGYRPVANSGIYYCKVGDGTDWSILW